MASISLPQLPDSLGNAEKSADAKALADAVEGEVRWSKHDRMLYATDASIYQVEPLGVVIPVSVKDGLAALRVCHARNLPILPRGSGTALAGQSVNRAVVIDFSAKCRNVIEVDPTARTAWVEPGVVLDQLNGILAPDGLMFGPDVATSSHATLGGMIGNNSAGANSILYGRTVENLIALDVALADGAVLRLEEGAAKTSARIGDITRRVSDVVLPIEDEIERRIPKIRRHVDGYNLDLILAQLRSSTPGTFDRVNLAHLLCGSEGTLGVTLAAKLALVTRPAHRGLVIAGFESVTSALAPLQAMIATGPSAVELVDDMVIAMAMRNPIYRRDVAVMPSPPSGKLGAVMYIQYFAQSREELAAKMDQLSEVLKGFPIARHTDPAAMEAAWRLRKAGEPLLHAVPGERKPVTFVEDTAVDPAKLGEFVERFRAIVERHGTTAAYYAHASVGCLHIRPLVALSQERDLGVVRAIAQEVADLVVEFGGALSGEHGDGRVRSPLLTRVLGAPIANALREIKKIFDPQGLLNPGNIVENDSIELITSKLRVRPDDKEFVHAPEVPTFFRYEREEGFSHALEQCNGAGLCRRLTAGGTMCPSYRVLKDERHATRGRANALRLAVTGQLLGASGKPAWDDVETRQTLDLCLSCKACKSECPSNVDVAKLKAEFTAQSFLARGRVGLRTRMLANAELVLRAGSAMWPISSIALLAAPISGVIKSLAGIAPQRSLPPIGRSLRRLLAQRRSARLAARGPESLQDQPTVLLFGDCFSKWSQPAVGLAAVELLEAFGYRVVLADVGCCGRAEISSGMLASAARRVGATSTKLHEMFHREGAVAIVGLEPSCISAIKDDWLELKSSASAHRLKSIASHTFLVEEWLDREWERHPIRPEFAKTTEKIRLHAHCHQKALWGAESSAALLRRVFGDRLETLATGCCGMAGSFGFAKKTYELSMAIGESDLFKKLESSGDSIICAPGTSCRHQISDGTSLEAMHPVELLARALRDAPMHAR